MKRLPTTRSTARAVRGASGMHTILPPLRTTVRGRCPRCSEVFDPRPDRFGHAQPIESQQRDQGVVAGTGGTGCDKHRSQLVAIQADRVGLVVELGSARVNCR